jgi:hypothetical protein
MAVAFDAKATSFTTSGATTSITGGFTKLTIGSVTNPGLIVYIQFGANPGAFTTATWNGVALTNIISASSSDGLSFAYLFGLAGPATGNHTLAMSWTNSSDWLVDAVSFSGVNQTGGATTFKNTNSVQATLTSGAAEPITITSPTGDMGVASYATSTGSYNTTSNTGTLVYSDNTNVSGAGIYLLGSGSSVMTMNTNAGISAPYIAVGCDIAAAGAADVLMSQAWL